MHIVRKQDVYDSGISGLAKCLTRHLRPHSHRDSPLLLLSSYFQHLDLFSGSHLFDDELSETLIVLAHAFLMLLESAVGPHRLGRYGTIRESPWGLRDERTSTPFSMSNPLLKTS